MTDEKDNVEYFPGKPGFYKKGPGQFKIGFGSLDDLIDETEEKLLKETDAKRIRIIKDQAKNE